MIWINFLLIFIFFTFSTKRVEDYFNTDFLTDLEPRMMLRHVPTRWLNLQVIFMQILEQFLNLKVYFLETVAT